MPAAAPSFTLPLQGLSRKKGGSLASATCSCTLAKARAALGAEGCRGLWFCTETSSS